MEKAGRGRRYGDISGRDKEEGVCVKGSDYPGQKTSASDSGDWNGSAETSAYIKKRLVEMGIPWKDCGGPLPAKMTDNFVEAGFPRMEKETGVTAVIGHGSPVYPSEGRHGCAAGQGGQ